MKTVSGAIRILCLVLSLFIICSLTVACGSQANTPATSAEQSQVSTAQTTSAADANVPSWQKDTSPVTLDWYDNTASITETFDPKNSLVDGVINQKTGVTINFSAPPEESYDKLNAMVASNTLPDIIDFSFDPTVTTFGQMEEAGLLYPILDLAEKNAPELKAKIPESMVNWYKYKDNNLYGLLSYFYAPEKMPANFPIFTSAGMVARQDILNQLGIKSEDFATKAGFEALLKKVKDAGLKAENGKPVYPIFMGYTVADVFGWVVTGMFGDYEEDKDGNMVSRVTSPKYLEAAKYVNQLYREGLIDISNFTSTKSQVAELATAGQLFAYLGHVGDFRGTMQSIFSNNPEMKYVPVEPVRADDNAQPLFSSQNTNGWTVTCITKNCKHPERAISLLSYLYSDEGQMTTLYGVEGKTYTMVDGHAQFTQEYLDAKKADAAKAAKDYKVGYYFMTKDPVFERTMTAPPTDEYSRIWYDTQHFYSKYVYPDRMFDVYPDPGTDEEATVAQIYDYETKFLPTLLMAKTEADVENKWNEMVNHENELGLQNVMKVDNAKFHANKAKLGVKFALPIYNN